MPVPANQNFRTSISQQALNAMHARRKKEPKKIIQQILATPVKSQVKILKIHIPNFLQLPKNIRGKKVSRKKYFDLLIAAEKEVTRIKHAWDEIREAYHSSSSEYMINNNGVRIPSTLSNSQINALELEMLDYYRAARAQVIMLKMACKSFVLIST